MVKPMLRTRSKKRVMTRLPGGKTVLHFKHKKPSKKTCARCNVNLAGSPSGSIAEIGKMSKSEKAPTRPYTGVLCPICVEKLISYKTRSEVRYKYPEYADVEIRRDLTLERFLPKGWFNSIAKK
jgi:large subunit ribosomal protein L34e